MELHVLARGEVAFAAAAEIGHVGEPLQLRGRQHAAGHFRAHHLHAGLALAVAAETQAIGTKIVVGDPPGEKILGLGAELFDLSSDGLIVLLLKRAADDGIVEQRGIGVGQKDTPYSLSRITRLGFRRDHARAARCNSAAFRSASGVSVCPLSIRPISSVLAAASSSSISATVRPARSNLPTR